MKTKIVFLIFLIVTFFSGHAQQIEYKVRELKLFINSQQTISKDWENELTEIEGSAYLNEKFTTGTIYTIQNSKYVDVPLRYNAYNDEMEFKNDNDEILAIAVPEDIKKIDIGKASFAYMPYNSGKKIKSGYFELIIEGNASLLVRHKIEYKEAQKAGALKNSEPPKFIQNPKEFYIQTRNEPASLVKNKKSLLEILSDHKDEIGVFIKNNNTKTNDIESLTNLVTHFNTLQ